MNTVDKGNAFENKVFTHIIEELSNDRLHVIGRRSKAYQKKGYFSKDRLSEIITDISIETFLPEATDYTLLTVIECKDYDTPIPVSDIEEFHSKIQQIAGDNVKAIFATSAALQKSALNYAKSKKIGVIRYLPYHNQLQWFVFYEAPKIEYFFNQKDEFNSAFVNQNHKTFKGEFYACYDKYIFPSLFSILQAYLNRRDLTKTLKFRLKAIGKKIRRIIK